MQYLSPREPGECDSPHSTSVQGSLETNISTSAHLRETINTRLGELSVREDHYLDLVGDPAWPTDKLRIKMQTIRDERDKLMVELDRLDADLGVARDIIGSALTLLAKPQRLYKAMTDSASSSTR